MKKVYIILYVCLYIILLLAIPVYATYHFSYKFESDITIICPDCNFYISCETNSMYPTLDCDDTLIGVEPNSKEDINVGDIIWFRGTHNQIKDYTDGTIFIVHRVKKIDYKGCYITQGDNNNKADEYTPCYYDVEFVIKGIIYE